MDTGQRCQILVRLPALLFCSQFPHFNHDTAGSVDAKISCGAKFHRSCSSVDLLLATSLSLPNYRSNSADIQLGSALIEVFPSSDAPARVLPGQTAPWEAPEALNKAPLDPLGLRRTDIYSYGLMVWRIMCNGRRPHKRTTSAGDFPYVLSEDEFERVKFTGDVLLALANDSLNDRCPGDVDKEYTGSIFKETIRFNPALRVSSFGEIIALLDCPSHSRPKQ